MAPRTHFDWRLRTRGLHLGERTLVMGIVNVTPDSFSDGGSYLDAQAAVEHGCRLLDEGADLLDVGAESTRPGATAITTDEEQARLLPVLAGVLAARPGTVISVDTYHAATAAAALEAGAEIINDVSGLLWDPAMGEVLRRAGAGVVLMHTRGRPQEWATLPVLVQAEVVPLVLQGLVETLRLADAAGLARERLVLDPGFGFGKMGAANYALLAGFAELQALGLPLLAGLSRKRFLTAALLAGGGAGSGSAGAALNSAPRLGEREQATVAGNVAAILGGAHLIRVHDAAAGRVAATIADAVLAG